MFKIGEVCIIKAAAAYPELVGEECTIAGPLTMHSTIQGNITGYSVHILGEKKYKGYNMVAPPYCLQRKKPPYHDWADQKVAGLLKGMKTPFAVRVPEKHHAPA